MVAKHRKDPTVPDRLRGARQRYQRRGTGRRDRLALLAAVVLVAGLFLPGSTPSAALAEDTHGVQAGDRDGSHASRGVARAESSLAAAMAEADEFRKLRRDHAAKKRQEQAAAAARAKALADPLAYLKLPGYGAYGGHPGRGPNGVPKSCAQYTHNMYHGCRLMVQAGFPLSQMPCLKKLWTRESNWDENAVNPGSKAWGIAQSWPGNKMASVGADWRTNPITQMKWGIKYIKRSYRTPCGAWNFWQAQTGSKGHWY